MTVTTDRYETKSADYARHDIGGTVLLAYRDIPDLIKAHGRPDLGRKAFDFGCGAGKSSRFLASLGFDVTGVDISPSQLAHARKTDPTGDYRLIGEGQCPFEAPVAAVALSVFCFLEMDTQAQMAAAARAVFDALLPGGIFIMAICAEDFYSGDWLTVGVDFPGNSNPASGDTVTVRLIDVDLDIVDTYWTDADYTAVLEQTGLTILERARPLGTDADGLPWKDERMRPPFVLYVAQRPDEG